MTRSEIVLELARSRGMTQREARSFVDAFVGAIERALTEGESVTLRSFGRFEVRERAGRSVHAPGTAGAKRIPARLAPAFRCAPGLLARLADGTSGAAASRPTGK